MSKYLSPETPIKELSTSTELLTFANNYSFESIKDLLAFGFKVLYKLERFDYRLQQEIVALVQKNGWDELLELD